MGGYCYKQILDFPHKMQIKLATQIKRINRQSLSTYQKFPIIIIIWTIVVYGSGPQTVV